jgi:hypothetical protein
MLVQAQAQAELVPAQALDQVREAADLALGRGWAERPVRQRLVRVLVA